MSAFMVSNETINCVCTIPADAGPCAARDLLGRELLAMNSAALAARYGEPLQTAADFADFRFWPRAYSPIQQYKALRCLRYQCAEGNVPEWPLFKRLETIAAALALAIVGRPLLTDEQRAEIIGRLPEYDKAQWDLREAPRGQKVTA